MDALTTAEQHIQALNEGLEETVEERTREVRALSARLAMAEQEERQRIAHILHDDLQQQLFGLGVSLSLLRGATGAERDELHDQAEEILDQAADLTRSLSSELSPPVLVSPHLEELLSWLALRKREWHGLEVEVEVEEPCEVPVRAVRVLLYHALREVLFNVVKHAGTKQAWLRARTEDGFAVVTVEDDGEGFDPNRVREHTKGGLGLSSIGERIVQTGGQLEVDSTPGDGTRVTIMVPLSDALSESDSPDEAAAE